MIHFSLIVLKFEPFSKHPLSFNYSNYEFQSCTSDFYCIEYHFIAKSLIFISIIHLSLNFFNPKYPSSLITNRRTFI
jgi:hypothetical protein